MEPVLPADGLQRLGIVVADYRSSIREFSRFFGIKTWHIRRFDASRLSDATFRQAPACHSFVSAVGTNSGFAFELVQPLSDQSVFAEFLARRGEGMHHLLTKTCSAAEFAAARAALTKNGIRICQSGCIDRQLDYYLLDTGHLLGGAVVQIVCPRGDCDYASLHADEVIEFDDAIVRWNELPVQKVYHVCTVTDGRRQAVRDAFRTILGIDTWFDFSNESNVSSVDTTYLGEPCSIAFNLSLGRKSSLAVEVVEMRYGDCLYTEWLTRKGEGLQHLMSTVCSEQLLIDLLPWLESQNMPLVMGGRAGDRDFCYYGYIDTRTRLAGMVIEVLCPAGPDWLVGREDAGAILLGPERV
jgi:methylmalonyl-CoA/ethylmalonyl-CoA epimerase